MHLEIEIEEGKGSLSLGDCTDLAVVYDVHKYATNRIQGIVPDSPEEAAATAPSLTLAGLAPVHVERVKVMVAEFAKCSQNKITCIKIVRTLLDIGLKEAKDLVDNSWHEKQIWGSGGGM